MHVWNMGYSDNDDEWFAHIWTKAVMSHMFAHCCFGCVTGLLDPMHCCNQFLALFWLQSVFNFSSAAEYLRGAFYLWNAFIKFICLQPCHKYFNVSYLALLRLSERPAKQACMDQTAIVDTRIAVPLWCGDWNWILWSISHQVIASMQLWVLCYVWMVMGVPCIGAQYPSSNDGP